MLTDHLVYALKYDLKDLRSSEVAVVVSVGVFCLNFTESIISSPPEEVRRVNKMISS